MSYKTIEIGLPFYDDINKQIVNKPYYNSSIKEWVCPDTAYPSFQFSLTPDATATMATFDLVNYDTGATTDLTTYFTNNVSVIDRDVYGYYFTHLGNIASSLTNGRYYFHAVSDNEGYERFSEVFVVRDLNITANPSAQEFRTIETGLPFFDNINKQVSKSPYHNSHIKDWLSADNRFLPFQISLGSSASGILTFNLVNSITGAITDYKAYFIANTTVELVDGEYIYSHLGLTDVTVSGGRYYFYAVSVAGRKWWSEEFVMCGDITKDTDYLLISVSDYLLIGGTDKLIIG